MSFKAHFLVKYTVTISDTVRVYINLQHTVYIVLKEKLTNLVIYVHHNFLRISQCALVYRVSVSTTAFRILLTIGPLSIINCQLQMASAMDGDTIGPLIFSRLLKSKII